uniref:Uncharacterized protein n=1 Tax=Brassica campestris TaxID=3711 RepID=M4DT44_BRACM
MEEELRDMKAHKDYTYDYLPGKRYFICCEFENDGMHFRQPWVTGMQQEVERFKKIFNEQEKLKRECEALKVSGNINCNMFVLVCNATCVTKRLVCLIYVQEQVKMLHLRLNELESSHSEVSV